MTKTYFLFISLSLSLLYSSKAQLSLIPTPQEVELTHGVFTLSSTTTIVPNSSERFYTDILVQCVTNELSLKLGTSSGQKESNSIEYIRSASPDALTKILKKHNLNTNFKPGAEGYILAITPSSIKIIAQTDAGIYYGIQTLKQLIKANRTGNSIPTLVIYDHPDIKVRAWQDDISRGPIPTMEVMKEQIETMAFYKLNHFSLYIEHVFKLEKHPKIAPQDGISKAEIDELSAFAKKHHVHLIGSYQSFGHMEETLKHPDYAHLAENDHIISPVLDASYEFLADVYEEIVPTFSGEYFNINCDETFGLGEGRSKTMVDTMGINGVYLYHINKLNKSLLKYDKKILMWGDIVGNHPEIIKKLPEDITVMMWNYGPVEDYEKAVTPFKNSGLNYWVAPGISCWNNIYPNYETAEINIYNLIRDGYKHNATGVFNTTWDDDGLNFFQNNWHGLIWGAENSWKAPKRASTLEVSNKDRELRYTAFNKAFDPLFYGLEKESLINHIIKFSDLHQASVREILRNDKFFEPIFPIHLDYVKKGKKEENLKILQELNELHANIVGIHPQVKHHKSTLDYLDFAMDQAEFLLHKNIFRIALHNYINGDQSISKESLKANIDKLISMVQQLRTTYAILWKQENRDYWLNESHSKYDDLINDLSNLEGHCMITPAKQLSENGWEIAIQSLFGDLPVYYTTALDTTQNVFVKYSQPLVINKDITLKARAQKGDKAYASSETHLIYHKGIGKLHKQHASYSTYHPSYDGGGAYALLDGKEGTADNLKSGRWQGFSGQDIDIEIDLGTSQTLRSFSMGFYQHTMPWVIFPKKIDILVKDNLTDTFTLVETITNKIPPESEGAQKHKYTATFDNLTTRYVKVVAQYYGKLPDWHPAGPTYESMLFADEIILK